MKKIAHLQLEISKDNLFSVRKGGNEQTDRHGKFFELLGSGVGTSQEFIQKISERYLIQNQRFFFFFSKLTLYLLETIVLE